MLNSWYPLYYTCVTTPLLECSKPANRRLPLLFQPCKSLNCLVTTVFRPELAVAVFVLPKSTWAVAASHSPPLPRSHVQAACKVCLKVPDLAFISHSEWHTCLAHCRYVGCLSAHSASHLCLSCADLSTTVDSHVHSLVFANNDKSSATPALQ